MEYSMLGGGAGWWRTHTARGAVPIGRWQAVLPDTPFLKNNEKSGFLYERHHFLVLACDSDSFKTHCSPNKTQPRVKFSPWTTSLQAMI